MRVVITCRQRRLVLWSVTLIATNQRVSQNIKMKAENNSENPSSVIAYLEEQSAIVRSGGYWNCLVATRELATRLLAEGRSPWIVRMRKTEMIGSEVFHGPLIPRRSGVSATWTTHYVSCCDDMAYDPVAGRPLRLETYSLEVFGEDIPMEVFVPASELPAYLAQNQIEPVNRTD